MRSQVFPVFLLRIIALTVLSAGAALAQVQVEVRMAKSQFVAHEEVNAIVTITNRAGRDLVLQGRGNLNWLSFEVWDSQGRPVSPRRGGAIVQAARVPAGQSVSKKIDLNRLFPVTEPGRYRARAAVRLFEGNGGVFGSNTLGFNITQARALFTQRVGLAGTQAVREYRVLTFSGNQKTELYVQVEDVKTGRVLQTQPLGEALMFRKPNATVDGNNNLHLLYLVNPSTFARIRMSPEGRLLGRDFHKRGTTGTPRLVTFANGEVQVAGGIPYDPNARREAEGKIRRLSERPAVLFE